MISHGHRPNKGMNADWCTLAALVTPAGYSKRYALVNNMDRNKYIEKILNDFVFLDCRLGSHPKLRSKILWLEQDILSIIASAPPLDYKFEMKYRIGEGITGHVAQSKKYLYSNKLQSNSNLFKYKDFVIRERIESYLGVPLIFKDKSIGVLSIDSKEKNYFQKKHIAIAQLLATIVVYAKLGLDNHINEFSVALGEALKRIRIELGLSQNQVAELLNKSRISVSRWEGGAQPPSLGPLYEWGEALGLLSPTSGSHVTLIDITPKLLKLLKDDPYKLKEFSPEKFEQFVANRFDRMGFDVTLTGASTQRDGGIDLIAVPKIRNVCSFLIAGQIKHHRSNIKTGREAVDRLLSWKDSDFRLGLLITNTGFTRDALWVASQLNNKKFVRLRDLQDLKRWIEDDYWSEKDWREIPNEIQLAPGVIISVPKPNIPSSHEIWPIDELDVGSL